MKPRSLTRRSVLAVLFARGGGMTAGQIADRFKHSWPTTSRHLGVLESAGLIVVEKRGRERVYTLHAAGVRAAARWCGWAFEAPAPEPGDWTGQSYASMLNATTEVQGARRAGGANRR